MSLLLLDIEPDDHLLALFPVGRGGDLVGIGALEGIQDPQNFVKGATDGSRVRHCQTDATAGVEDEDGADGEGGTGSGVEIRGIVGFLIEHPVQGRNLQIPVGNDREPQQPVSGVLANVGSPVTVAADPVRG